MLTANVRPADSVAVYGCGGVGLSILQGAKLCGAQTLIAVDSSEVKLKIAAEFGAPRTHCQRVKLFQSKSLKSPADAVRTSRSKRSATPRVRSRRSTAIRPGGTLVLAGLSAMGTGTNLPAAIITRQEKTIKGSYYGSVHPRRAISRCCSISIGQADSISIGSYRSDIR